MNENVQNLQISHRIGFPLGLENWKNGKAFSSRGKVREFVSRKSGNHVGLTRLELI